MSTLCEVTTHHRASLNDLPVWVRLVLAIGVMLSVTWSLMIYLTYAQQRNASIAQSRSFAESINQMTVATITAMMITGVAKERGVFLDQVSNSSDINDLRVFRASPIVAAFGPGEASEANPSSEEKAVMESGQPYFVTNEREGYLRAIFPILNSSNFLGKNCMTCHQGKEDEVLGAVSMKVSLKKAQVELRNFTWWIALVALCLSLPLLGSIYLFIRRFVTRPVAEAVRVAEALANGDLSQKIHVNSRDEIGKLLSALKGTVEHLTQIVSGIKQSTDTIHVASKEIATGNADLSQRTEEQASSLEETASSMEELTSTVKQNSENAKQANQLAASASEVALKGGTVVSEVVGTMSSINESSKKIVDIISVIDGIAFQTNILALNAAVEAARAGEQGRGFAVVAAEVRNLAQRSAAAAKEIKQLIGDSVDKVGAGTKLADEAGKTMQEIVSSVKRVTDIMSEITAASQEQSSGIEQVNQAITQMDQVTQQNSALVEQAAAAAESMQEQAQNLMQAVSVFRLANANDGSAARVVERREAATRPANVARLPANAGKAKRATARTAPAHTRTGTDDQWSEF